MYTISVGPKPFAVAQRTLSTCRNTIVQTADIACLQIGGLCWYPSEGNLPLGLPLGYIGFIGHYLLYLQVWGKLILRFKSSNIRFTLHFALFEYVSY